MLIHLDFIKCKGRKTESDMCAQTAFVGQEADLRTLMIEVVTFDPNSCHRTEKLESYFMFAVNFFRNTMAHHQISTVIYPFTLQS